MSQPIPWTPNDWKHLPDDRILVGTYHWWAFKRQFWKSRQNLRKFLTVQFITVVAPIRYCGIILNIFSNDHSFKIWLWAKTNFHQIWTPIEKALVLCLPESHYWTSPEKETLTYKCDFMLTTTTKKWTQAFFWKRTAHIFILKSCCGGIRGHHLVSNNPQHYLLWKQETNFRAIPF